MQKAKVFIFLPLLLTSCGQAPQNKTLVASFYPVAYLVERIAGDVYNVETLVPAGEEPHDFDLRPSGARAIENASAIFLNGLGMENWAESLSASVKEKSHVLSEGLETLTIDGRVDPHIWLDVGSYLQMGKKVMETLSDIDAQNAAVFSANFASFSQDIANLDAYCASLAASFDNKVIAVNHAAFGYMARRYDFTQLYINNVSPSEEPSQKALESILDAIKEHGIDTVFFEELASDEVARKIAEATGAKCESLNPLEGLEEEQAKEGADYFSVYKENMDKIARAKP